MDLPSHWWLRIAFAGAALFGCALFSFMETSITALRLFNLKELAQKTGRYPYLFHTLEKEPQRVLIAILMANCIVNVIAADLITALVGESFAGFEFSHHWNFAVGVAVATIGILVFGEIIPKSLARGNSDRLLQSTLWIANITFYLMSPFVKVFSAFARRVLNLFRSEHSEATAAVASEKEIQFLIEYVRQTGQIDADKFEMLHGIFDLADTTIQEIMVPETEVVTLNVTTSLDDTLKLFSRYHFSRLPVYDSEPDNIIGMVHQKDLFLLLANKEDRPLKDLVRPILFVPESMRVNQLLRQFKQQRHHIAMVVNEQGTIIGLVTLEDTLEEIVGDINDEHEAVAEYIVPLEQGGWLVYGGADLEMLGKKLEIVFESADAVTLGGFLIESFGHVPKKGEQFAYKGYTFQIQKATQKRVIQILIFKTEDAHLFS